MSEVSSEYQSPPPVDLSRAIVNPPARPLTPARAPGLAGRSTKPAPGWAVTGLGPGAANAPTRHARSGPTSALIFIFINHLLGTGGAPRPGVAGVIDGDPIKDTRGSAGPAASLLA